MRRLVFASLILFALAGHSALAEDFSSASFLMRDPSFGAFGGAGTSSSFQSVLQESQIEGQRASSASFMLDMGPMNMDTAAFATKRWRWYADEEHATPLTPLAGENAAPIDIEDQEAIKLRITVAETAGFGMAGTKFKLQFATSSDFAGAYDVAEENACDGATWCYADGGGTDNLLIASSTLSDADTCSTGAESGCGTHNESGISISSQTHEASAAAEYDFTIKQSGAAINTAYFFRLFDTVANAAVPLGDGEAYPSLLTGGASLTFVVDGVPAGVMTENVLTGITTSSTDLSFGLLPSSGPVAGAQRLTVSTNGTKGYRVYLYERQGLVSETSAEIAPVSGTNASPLGWENGCSANASGCFGYHSGDDLLSDQGGGSTRFAPDNTYAHATTTPHEVAYHDGPIANQSTDIVYQIEARSGQENGSYSTSVVYIVTPIF